MRQPTFCDRLRFAEARLRGASAFLSIALPEDARAATFKYARPKEASPKLDALYAFSPSDLLEQYRATTELVERARSLRCQGRGRRGAFRVIGMSVWGRLCHLASRQFRLDMLYHQAFQTRLLLEALAKSASDAGDKVLAKGLETYFGNDVTE